MLEKNRRSEPACAASASGPMQVSASEPILNGRRTLVKSFYN